MTKSSYTRFTDDEIDQMQSWTLPDITSQDAVLTARKERELAKKALKQKQKSQQASQSLEEVNDVESLAEESREEEYKPLTAEQLAEITEAAEAEGYQAGLEKGLQEGTEQGLKQGYEEGLANGKKLITEQCERLEHLLTALMTPVQSEHQYLEAMLVDMVGELTKAVVKRELQTDSSHITELVDQALSMMPTAQEKYAIYLNSQDIEVVENHLHAIDKQFVYHIDDKLLPGGCRVETQNTFVDFSVEKRLSEVIDNFVHKRFSVGEVPQPNQGSAKDQDLHGQPADADEVKPDPSLVETSHSETTEVHSAKVDVESTPKISDQVKAQSSTAEPVQKRESPLARKHREQNTSTISSRPTTTEQKTEEVIPPVSDSE